MSIFSVDFASGQGTPLNEDTTKLYRNIESYSEKSKFARFLHGLVFKPVDAGPDKKKSYKKLIQKPYSAFEGKIVRHIYIETLDPFGYSIADTSARAHNFISKTGNALHVKSRALTIRNLLLIRQNQPFDSLLVKESERLVRKQSYIRDVSFFVKTISPDSDSVDIYIRELDNWSIIPGGAVSKTRVTVKLMEKNFIGSGHEFKSAYTWNHASGNDAFMANYFVPNISNTHITATVNYGIDEYGNTAMSVSTDRPFFSPLTKWAAGVILTQQFRRDSIQISDSVTVLQRFKYNTHDYWAGNAIRIYKGNTEKSRTSNFIYALRYSRIHYLEKPIEMYDSLHRYSNDDFYLASIGISARNYVQDRYIFNYGYLEDVPVGKVYSLTGGYQVRNNVGGLYLGARISTGNYYTWGYLSTNFEYGTFFHGSRSERGVFLAGVNYFTGLFEPGKWKFRQFAKVQAAFGINRFSYESVTLNEGYGMNGFSSPDLNGTSRLLLTLQTQSYSPWNLIGFRFGPFLTCSFGMLSDPVTGFKNSRVYSQIGLGVLIKNEYLVINNFQLSISFFPLIPGIGENVFITNAFRTTDFGFRDFELGKPVIVGYQ